MVAAVESMAWTGEVPWHREGVKVDPQPHPTGNDDCSTTRLDS
jgi:hypothetical protein